MARFILKHFYFLLLFEAGSIEIRLIGNPTKKAVVEVFTGSSRWGRICPVNWYLSHAHIVCNHFGYITALSATDIRSDDSTHINNGSTTQNVIQVFSNCKESTITPCVSEEMSTECECSTLNAGVICGNGNNGYTTIFKPSKILLVVQISSSSS